eukprot:scaffold6460_cov69-Phaeocystis_antarctica.AAC.1
MKQPRDEAPAICTQEVERREVLGWGSVVGRNGRCVIDLRLPTGREGGRRRGRERRRWGGTARRGYASKVWRFRREGWWRVRQGTKVGKASAGLVALSGGIGAV